MSFLLLLITYLLERNYSLSHRQRESVNEPHLQTLFCFWGCLEKVTCWFGVWCSLDVCVFVVVLGDCWIFGLLVVMIIIF